MLWRKIGPGKKRGKGSPKKKEMNIYWLPFIYLLGILYKSVFLIFTLLLNPTFYYNSQFYMQRNWTFKTVRDLAQATILINSCVARNFWTGWRNEAPGKYVRETAHTCPFLMLTHPPSPGLAMLYGMCWTSPFPVGASLFSFSEILILLYASSIKEFSSKR